MRLILALRYLSAVTQVRIDLNISKKIILSKTEVQYIYRKSSASPFLVR